jgi:hypothetical protein
MLINGHSLGRLELAPGMTEYDLRAPEACLFPGRNQVVFRFDRADTASAVLAGSEDKRTLAVRFDYVHFKRAAPEASSAAPPQTVVVNFGEDDSEFVVSGWEAPERDERSAFRWADRLESEVVFSVSDLRAVRLRLRVAPLTFDGWPGQAVKVILNGRTLARIPLKPEMSDYELMAPADCLALGTNRMVFRFERLDRVSAVMPGSNDDRELAARFERLTLEFVSPTER